MVLMRIYRPKYIVMENNTTPVEYQLCGWFEHEYQAIAIVDSKSPGIVSRIEVTFIDANDLEHLRPHPDGGLIYHTHGDIASLSAFETQMYDSLTP